MKPQNDTFTVGMDRLNALMGWWGVSAADGNGLMNSQMRSLQKFVTEAQKICGNAYSEQMSALLTSNERIAHLFQELPRCQRPHELLAAESEIFASLLESASQQATRWVKLTQKLEECCAEMARDTADDLRHTDSDKGPGLESEKQEQREIKIAGKHQIHT